MGIRKWLGGAMLILLLIGLLVTGLPYPGYAEEKADGGGTTEPSSMEALTAQPVEKKTTLLGPFSLQAGLKTWYAQWQTRTAVNQTLGANQQTSVFAPMIGPQITLGYARPGAGDWFKGAYMSYQYLNAGFGLHEAGNATNALNLEAQSAIRTDTTFTASIPVYKGYGVFGGYYQSLQRFQFPQTATQAALLFKGPIVGAFGSQPIPDTRASLYGNVGLGWLSVHPSQPAGQGTNQNWSTDSVMAYSVETGVNYGLPDMGKVRPSLQIGFRAQVLQQTYGSTLSGAGPFKSNDILWGPTIQIAAAF